MDRAAHSQDRDSADRLLELLAHHLIRAFVTIRIEPDMFEVEDADTVRKRRSYSIRGGYPHRVFSTSEEQYFVLCDGGEMAGVAMRNIHRYYTLTVKAREKKVRYRIVVLRWGIRAGEVISSARPRETFNFHEFDLVLDAHHELFTDYPFCVSKLLTRS